MSQHYSPAPPTPPSEHVAPAIEPQSASTIEPQPDAAIDRSSGGLSVANPSEMPHTAVTCSAPLADIAWRLRERRAEEAQVRDELARELQRSPSELFAAGRGGEREPTVGAFQVQEVQGVASGERTARAERTRRRVNPLETQLGITTGITAGVRGLNVGRSSIAGAVLGMDAAALSPVWPLRGGMPGALQSLLPALAPTQSTWTKLVGRPAGLQAGKGLSADLTPSLASNLAGDFAKTTSEALTGRILGATTRALGDTVGRVHETGAAGATFLGARTATSRLGPDLRMPLPAIPAISAAAQVTKAVKALTPGAATPSLLASVIPSLAALPTALDPLASTRALLGQQLRDVLPHLAGAALGRVGVDALQQATQSGILPPLGAPRGLLGSAFTWFSAWSGASSRAWRGQRLTDLMSTAFSTQTRPEPQITFPDSQHLLGAVFQPPSIDAFTQLAPWGQLPDLASWSSIPSLFDPDRLFPWRWLDRQQSRREWYEALAVREALEAQDIDGAAVLARRFFDLPATAAEAATLWLTFCAPDDETAWHIGPSEYPGQLSGHLHQRWRNERRAETAEWDRRHRHQRPLQLDAPGPTGAPLLNGVAAPETVEELVLAMLAPQLDPRVLMILAQIPENEREVLAAMAEQKRSWDQAGKQSGYDRARIQALRKRVQRRATVAVRALPPELGFPLVDVHHLDPSDLGLPDLALPDLPLPDLAHNEANPSHRTVNDLGLRQQRQGW